MHEALTELVATAFLLIAVVALGIMAEQLCGGNVGLALLVNAIATGGALVALILDFGPQSGARMNPVVTLVAAATEGLHWHAVPAYVAQIIGAILGVWLTHVMFDLPVWQLSPHARTGLPQWMAEVIATFDDSMRPHSAENKPLHQPALRVDRPAIGFGRVRGAYNSLGAIGVAVLAYEKAFVTIGSRHMMYSRGGLHRAPIGR